MRDSVESTVSYIKSALDSGKKYIVFNCPCEALQTFSLNKIHVIVERLPGINVKNVFYVTGTVPGQVEYDSYAEKAGHAFRITILGTISQISNFLESAKAPYLVRRLDTEYEIKIKEKKFVCFNKVHKGHRLYILAKMLENGLINQSYFSFEGARPNWYKEIDHGTYNWAPIIEEQVKKNLHLFPIRLNITADRTNPVQLAADDLEYHLNSYFSLVTETVFYRKNSRRAMMYCNEDGVFFTEKVARPFLLKHPFILAGYVNSLKMLRTYGYKTFHPYIDESYDMEEDDDHRLDMIVAETERLCRFTDDQWIEFQTNIKPIVEHNYLNLRDSPSYHGISNLLDKFK